MQLLLFRSMQSAMKGPLQAVRRIIAPARPATPPQATPLLFDIAAAVNAGTRSVSSKAKKPRLRMRRAVSSGPAKAPLPARPLTAEQLKYESITQHLLQEFEIEVRKYRQSLSGCAYELRYRDGRTAKRCIEVPLPRTQLSLAVFLHEIGHHAIGFDRFKPRCVEEYYAWKFAIDAMHEHNIEIAQEVHDRMRRSLRYAVQKAMRRGLRKLPAELLEFVPEASNWSIKFAKRKQ